MTGATALSNPSWRAKAGLVRSIVRYSPSLIKSIPSRLLFGTNTSFWRANALPYLEWCFANGKPNLTSEIHRKGFQKAATVLIPDFWVRLKEIYDRCIANDAKVTTAPSGKKRWLTDTAEELGMDNIRAILNDPSFRSIINDYYGESVYLQEVDAWRNFPAGETEYAYSNFWHMDDTSYSSLRVFCYLSSGVNEKTGATRIVPLPESKAAVRRLNFLHTSIDGVEAKEHIPSVYLSGDLGDVFVFSADRCLHAATAILQDRPRDMLQLVIDRRRWPTPRGLNIPLD